jgi:hypothetical protein
VRLCTHRKAQDQPFNAVKFACGLLELALSPPLCSDNPPGPAQLLKVDGSLDTCMVRVQDTCMVRVHRSRAHIRPPLQKSNQINVCTEDKSLIVMRAKIDGPCRYYVFPAVGVSTKHFAHLCLDLYRIISSCRLSLLVLEHGCRHSTYGTRLSPLARSMTMSAPLAMPRCRF